MFALYETGGEKKERKKECDACDFCYVGSTILWLVSKLDKLYFLGIANIEQEIAKLTIHWLDGILWPQWSKLCGLIIVQEG